MRRAYFMDFTLDTHNSTFRPRPETELLVEKTLILLKKIKKNTPNPAILDIGTGSGNIAISLTKYDSSSKIVGLDMSESALYAASCNAREAGVDKNIKFIKSNLFDSLPDAFNTYFDIIVSNPPYISLNDLKEAHSSVKDDPYLALYGGLDGLKFYRAIIGAAPRFLKPGGTLIMEIGYDQSEQVNKLLIDSGYFSGIEVYKDYAGIDRIVKTELIPLKY